MAKEERQPLWVELRYPDEDAYIKAMYDFPDYEGRLFADLPAWYRLGWPSQDLWDRCARTEEREQARERKTREPNPWPVARKTWADVLKIYPLREGVPDTDQDVQRVLRFWPDCFGQPIVDVELILKDGITVNTLTYGPGKHRVPASVAIDLRFIDGKARQDYMDQFIPKRHQDRVLATFSMSGAVGAGEVRE
jgi:hypothetical protein